MEVLVAALFPWECFAAQALKGFDEKVVDIVRLNAPRHGPFHLLLERHHLGGVHPLLHQGPLLDQLLEVFGVNRLIHFIEACFDLWIGVVANGIDQQIP